MKSLVVIAVEHSEDIDSLDSYIQYVANIQPADAPLDLIDWTVRVDIPNQDMDYTFRFDPGAQMVTGLHSRDHHHTTFPGD